MIFTSCCLQHPRRVRRVQYVRVCPRFPLPDFFPPGRLSWDGDWQKGRREPIKEVLVLPLITKGARISRMICLHSSLHASVAVWRAVAADARKQP